ncbi:MAG TPA: anthranilate phosphoribosyltransferase [Terrimicrobiaceae bacterium]
MCEVLSDLTQKVRMGGDLTKEDIFAACELLLDETAAVDARADFLRALHTKGETAFEVAAFVDVLLTRSRRPELGEGLLDVCGTGGDRAGLFNVSTAVMFVVAACGARVVKHGNRGVTSKCGGADVLEALGIRIDLPPEAALDAAGCCFLFAPSYHPAFKAVAPVRRSLAAEGSATIFNLLGPLLNPARLDFQLAGVFDPKLLALYAETFRLLERKSGWAVHGCGCLDEVSTLGSSEVHAMEAGAIRQFSIQPETLGFAPARIDDLRGGDAPRNAQLLEEILRGQERGPKREIVVLNAACALVVAEISRDLSAGIRMAVSALDEGSAYAVLLRLRELR